MWAQKPVYTGVTRITDSDGPSGRSYLHLEGAQPLWQERRNWADEEAEVLHLCYHMRTGCALTVFLTALLLGGNALAAPCDLGPGDHSFTMQLGGVTREYLVHVPAGCNPTTPRPLVIDLHALSATSRRQENKSGFEQKSDQAGFVVAYPQAYNGVWNAGWCCMGLVDAASRHDLDELAFLRAIVSAVEKVQPIDRTRVYATGHSNGGALSHFSACNAADLFAAVVPVSFSLWPDNVDSCNPAGPIAVLQFHGLQDDQSRYDGSFNMLAAPQSSAKWARLNGCQGNPVRTFTKGGSYCDVYQQCREGVQVGLCSVQAAHDAYDNSDAVSIAELGWNFMSQFRLSGTTPPPPPPTEPLGKPGQPRFVAP